MVLEIRADAIGVSASLDSQISDLEEQGMSPADIADRMASMEANGRGPLAELGGSVSDSVDGVCSRAVAQAATDKITDGDGEAMVTWMTTGASNVCPGCGDLHGQQMTADEFMATHGTNECGSRCYCFAVPGDVPASDAPLNLEGD